MLRAPVVAGVLLSAYRRIRVKLVGLQLPHVCTHTVLVCAELVSPIHLHLLLLAAGCCCCCGMSLSICVALPKPAVRLLRLRRRHVLRGRHRSGSCWQSWVSDRFQVGAMPCMLGAQQRAVLR